MRSIARGLLGLVAFTALTSSAPFAQADEVEECAAAAEKGQELRDQSKLVEARESLVRCAQSSCPKLIRGDCEKWLPEIEARIPTIVLQVVDDAGGDLASVKVERNGGPWLDKVDGSAVQVNPGAIKLKLTADGYDPVEKEVVVAEGQRGRIIEIKMVKTGSGATPGTPGTETPPPGEAGGSGPGPLPWIAMGVGVAGLGTFAITQILASGEVSDVEDGCGATKSCGDAELDPIRTKLTISAIGLGVGIAGVGASIAMFALMGGDSKSDSAVRVTPVVGPTTAGAFVDVPLRF
jgi:hypothetical protein